MLRPLAVPEAHFDAERSKLRGMNETVSKITVKHEYRGDQDSLKNRVYEIANLSLVPCTETGKINSTIQILAGVSHDYFK